MANVSPKGNSWDFASLREAKYAKTLTRFGELPHFFFEKMRWRKKIFDFFGLSCRLSGKGQKCSSRKAAGTKNVLRTFFKAPRLFVEIGGGPILLRKIGETLRVF